ncbi:phosphohistidine phosphatase SixA [Orbus sturtevantii]|uniref:phosphohistidine phosphatase SixA n=1 Tax=Orbus sturtevantii TaxID=3074109 RepID=UPI00370DC063
MIKIYVMRHGEAGYSAISDSSRSLTPLGHKQCTSVANWLNAQNITFDLALVSPYVRAQQTFSIIANAVGVKQNETNDLLKPNGHAAHIVDNLNLLPLMGVESVLIVSHLPLVGYLVNELCPQVTPPMFSTADLACVSLSKTGEGILEWFHHPT